MPVMKFQYKIVRMEDKKHVEKLKINNGQKGIRRMQKVK